MEGHDPQHSVDETAAQRQARIRRERREAKIKAGGSARLDKITSVSGRPAELGGSERPLNFRRCFPPSIDNPTPLPWLTQPSRRSRINSTNSNG